MYFLQFNLMVVLYTYLWSPEALGKVHADLKQNTDLSITYHLYKALADKNLVQGSVIGSTLAFCSRRPQLKSWWGANIFPLSLYHLWNLKETVVLYKRYVPTGHQSSS